MLAHHGVELALPPPASEVLGPIETLVAADSEMARRALPLPDREGYFEGEAHSLGRRLAAEAGAAPWGWGGGTTEYALEAIKCAAARGAYECPVALHTTLPMILADDLIAGMELAYSAFNCPDWIELLVRVPTPIADGISVHHYSRSLHLDAHNQMVPRPGARHIEQPDELLLFQLLLDAAFDRCTCLGRDGLDPWPGPCRADGGLIGAADGTDSESAEQ
mgnify:CR=1 FL=1